MLPKERCSARSSRLSSKRVILSSPVAKKNQRGYLRRKKRGKLCIRIGVEDLLMSNSSWEKRTVHTTYPIFCRPVQQKDDKRVTSSWLLYVSFRLLRRINDTNDTVVYCFQMLGKASSTPQKNWFFPSISFCRHHVETWPAPWECSSVEWKSSPEEMRIRRKDLTNSEETFFSRWSKESLWVWSASKFKTASASSEDGRVASHLCVDFDTDQTKPKQLFSGYMSSDLSLDGTLVMKPFLWRSSK